MNRRARVTAPRDTGPVWLPSKAMPWGYIPIGSDGLVIADKVRWFRTQTDAWVWGDGRDYTYVVGKFHGARIGGKHG